MADNDETPSSGRSLLPWIPAFILPFVTAGIALVGGVALGAAGDYALRPAEVRVETKTRDLSTAELDQACQPKVAAVTDELNKAADQVTTLVGEVKAKEAKVTELETEMKRRGVAGANMKKQLDQARAELAEAKKALQVALEEKEQLVRELKKAIVDLDDQKVETTKAKQLAYDNGWDAFVAQGQLEVCERGSRKKLGKCREAVVASLASMHDNYQYCLKTGQAKPSFQEAERKQTDIPQFAQWMDQENRVLKGWYVQLCDPTLPEAMDYTGKATITTPTEPVPPVDGSSAALTPEAPAADEPQKSAELLEH